MGITEVGGKLVLYGGLDQVSSPTSDCWQLLDQDWQEVDLAYDHGEVRCWHTAICLEGELVIHAGLTQEYYLTRPDLDDHCDDVLTIRFGVMSLRRLCLDLVVGLVEAVKDEVMGAWLEILPR